MNPTEAWRAFLETVAQELRLNDFLDWLARETQPRQVDPGAAEYDMIKNWKAGVDIAPVRVTTLDEIGRGETIA
ncbi:hypothetical protein [Sphingomonas sp. MMS24-J13]|uniref:hypothetical protein n=1 Tax=Sphingomonas sp. MMS24-J13 TaxID=3238686 RepID=UPI003850A601